LAEARGTTSHEFTLSDRGITRYGNRLRIVQTPNEDVK
jgi:hypothetical protein